MQPNMALMPEVGMFCRNREDRLRVWETRAQVTARTLRVMTCDNLLKVLDTYKFCCALFLFAACIAAHKIYLPWAFLELRVPSLRQGWVMLTSTGTLKSEKPAPVCWGPN